MTEWAIRKRGADRTVDMRPITAHDQLAQGDHMTTQATQALTLHRGAPVHWHAPGGKTIPAVVVEVIDVRQFDTTIELTRSGAGYVKGDRVTVSAQKLTARP